MMSRDEITPETRLLLIELAEGFAEGVRNGTFRFSETTAGILVETIKTITSAKPKSIERICNITRACGILGISQPTFRKYIRQGLIPKGRKISGCSSLVWDKEDIERFMECRGMRRTS